jgi:GNAT superfamily N-acetyltransferase
MAGITVFLHYDSGFRHIAGGSLRIYPRAMNFRLVQALKTHRSSLPWVVVKKLFARVLKVETLVVYSRDLQSSPRESRVQSSVLDVIRVGDPQQEAFMRLCLKYPEKNFRARLRQEGQHCVIALRNNSIAGYAWIADKDLYIDEIAHTYTVARGEIFIYDCFVDEEHRGAGIYPAMLTFILDDASRSGNSKTACIAAAAVNQASIRGIIKAGFIEQKRIRFVEYRQKQKWWGLDPVGQA